MKVTFFQKKLTSIELVANFQMIEGKSDIQTGLENKAECMKISI